MPRPTDKKPQEKDRSSLGELESAFLSLAVERGLLTAQARAEIEAACGRARGEGESLRAWRAAVVRGHVAKIQADRILAEVAADNVLDSTEDRVAAVETEAPRAQPTVGEEKEGRIAALALETGLVSETQLKLAKKTQRSRRREKKPHGIGAALASEGFLPEALFETLAVLEARRSARGPEDPLCQALAADLAFAKTALDLQLVGPDELDRAVSEQKRRIERAEGARALTDGLAFILVEQRAMNADARSLVLELVERPNAARAPQMADGSNTDEEATRFLTENNLVTATQIARAVELQGELRGRGIDRRVGDLLVLQGAIDRPTLETIDRARDVRKRAPAKRRRAQKEEVAVPAAEHPLTTVAGLLLACVLISVYLLATDGFALLRGDGSASRPSSSPRERGRSG